MANTRAWKNASVKYGLSFGSIDLNTPETYSLIREMGLPTVLWKQYSVNSNRDLEKMLKSANAFIKHKNPCLFIWDPTVNSLDKGYFVNVGDSDIIFDWVKKNKTNVKNYRYLITTQIINPGNGFVGNAISDGNGKMFVETLHTPGVVNHRALTQPREKDSDYIDFFSVENFELDAVSRGILSGEGLRKIVELYSTRRGFFEFNCGEHLGNKGIYTIGFQKHGIFEFPQHLHYYHTLDISSRARSRGYKQFI